MKGFTRREPLFSLCGLKCGLCRMHLGGYCPGCGGGGGQPELRHRALLPGTWRPGILLGLPRVPLRPLRGL